MADRPAVLDAPADSNSLRILHADAYHALARYRTVLFSIWGATPTPAQAELTYREAMILHRAHTNGGYLHIVSANRAPERLKVEEGTRSAFARMLRDCGTFSGAALVVEAGGFFGAAVRGTVVGVTLVARPKVPTKVCTTVDEAARWLTGKLEAGGASCGSPLELAAVVARVRASMHA